jgi:hypothetical protein
MLAAAFCDSGRQTDARNVFDVESSNNAHHCLHELGYGKECVERCANSIWDRNPKPTERDGKDRCAVLLQSVYGLSHHCGEFDCNKVDIVRCKDVTNRHMRDLKNFARRVKNMVDVVGNDGRRDYTDSYNGYLSENFNLIEKIRFICSAAMEAGVL